MAVPGLGRSPRSDAATPGSGLELSTLKARANHSLWMGLTGSLLKAPPRIGPERALGGSGTQEEGHPGFQAIWGTHGKGTYTHWIPNKGNANPEPDLFVLKKEL